MYIIICVSLTKSLCISKNWMPKTLFHFKTTYPLPFSHMIVWHTTRYMWYHTCTCIKQAGNFWLCNFLCLFQSIVTSLISIILAVVADTHTAIQTWNSLVWWNKLLISIFICTFLQDLIKSRFKQKFNKHESLPIKNNEWVGTKLKWNVKT